ncbi:FAD/NAD(P)-binding domain-containing protein [Lojkania enalia]|uniref:FAD/NAD(P)-binding domain-containing protein n=1 Tax=Lojkania enalia TaxID=147567 RepID=A0A9P4N5T3_9PLEO|nr:FAD/NAD(P)-binding domain-containing protein [Didymosphaeria enalia]
MEEAVPTIAIIGAGISGLALAIALSHLNIPFTIYESATQFSATGAGIGLGPNALRAMDLIDRRFRSKYMEIATGNLRAEKKHVMMEGMLMEEGLGQGQVWWGKAEWGGENFERTGAHRKDLLEVMTGFVERGRVRFGKRVVRIEQRDGEVEIVFEDGEKVMHMAAVGCDGVKGFSRRVVLGERFPREVEPKYTGKYAYRAIVKMEDARSLLGDLATDAKMYMGVGSNYSTYPISKGKEINVVAFKMDSEPWKYPGNTHEVTREEMMADFREHRLDRRLMKLLDYAKPLRWGIFHHPRTPTYYSSQICLLGDSAHASGPHQAAGAGQGLEDALILSRVLGKLYRTKMAVLSKPCRHRTRLMEAAFQAYDEIRRPRAQEQVRTAEECGEVYMLRGAGIGESMEAVVRDMDDRFKWIWERDLEADCRAVEERFLERVATLTNENA